MLTRGFVTKNQCIGLPPVDQGKGDAGKGDVKKRALSFYDVPMILIIIRSEPLYRPRHKVGRNCIQRNTIACDQYPCLACRPEIHIYISLSHLRSMASPAYILPTEQSVPTARQRFPERTAPLPMGYSRCGTRTSNSSRPLDAAASTSAGILESRL